MSELGRRAFMKAGALALLGLGAVPPFLVRTAKATTPGSSTRASVSGTRAAARRAQAARASSYLLTGAIIALGLAAPATAAPEDTRDPGRDVVSGPLYSDALPKKPEPARRVGDITRSTVALGSDLVLTTRFRSLQTTAEQDFQWFILTSDHEDGYWTAYLTVPAGSTHANFELVDPIANQPGCASAAVERPGRKATVTIPASCLGDPDWVKVANGLMVITDTRVYWDDARRDGEVRRSWKFGPKVTAG